MSSRTGVPQVYYDQKREEFYIWYFNPQREGTQGDWAKANGIDNGTITNWKRRPDFIAKMEEWRKTYREDADEAVRNLIRFSHDPNPRVALPAIKILVDVMGYTSPIKVEHTAKGMGLMDYLVHIGQKAIQEVVENGGDVPLPAVAYDPWMTADPERLN